MSLQHSLRREYCILLRTNPGTSLESDTGPCPTADMRALVWSLTCWLVQGAGTSSTMGVWYGGLQGCATMNWALWVRPSDIRLGTMQEVDEAMMVLSSTMASMAPQTFFLRSRFSGTHSWMYLAPVTHSSRLSVPSTSLAWSAAARLPLSVPAVSNSTSSDLMFSIALDTWFLSTS